jgi:NAD+ synthase (glutamine-hydrolysing)
MPRDLLREPAFLDACERSVEALAADRGLPPLIVGAPVRAPGGEKPLVNAAILIDSGTRHVVAKRLLPNYDVFDERRYFRPGRPGGPVDVGGTRVGITICEDIWNDADSDADPTADLAAAGAEVIVNLSASPYCVGKPGVRRRVLSEHAARHRLPMALVNLVGCNDQLVFDGGSCAVDAGGALCAAAAAFAEDVVTTDLTGSARPPAGAGLREAIVLGIRDYFAKTGFTRALVGMSGGVDSSLVAALAVEALGTGGVTGVGMPGPFSADYSLDDAREVARRLGITFETVSITEAYRLVLENLSRIWGDSPFGLAEENLQARLRGTILMSLANKIGALVLVPSNKSELAMGYCTLYGDTVGALAPVADLYKTEVFALARGFDLPSRVLERPPSAELAPGQRDEDSLPPYEVLDPILRLHLEERLRPDEIVERGGFPRETVAKVLRTVSRTEFKRQQGAPVLKLTPKAFGLGRRFPIVERYRGGVE